MRDEQLRAVLDGGGPAEDAARARTWAVVQHAYAGREAVPRPRRRRPLVLAAATVLVATAVGAAVLAPPGRAVVDWLGDRLAPAPAERPRLEERARSEPVRPPFALPAPGRLLVVGEGGAWVVQAGGARRRLGVFDDASWSPHGLHVVVVRGRELLAVVPGSGAVRWTLARPGRLALPRWAPGDGYRVAYLGETVGGWRLRVLNGDGTGDRDLAAALPGVAPAWRPAVGAGYVLAHGLPGRRLGITPVDEPARSVVVALASRPVALAWSADGERLAAVGPGTVQVLDPSGRRVARRPLPAGLRARAAVAMPQGRALVVVADRADGGSAVLLVDLDRAGTPRMLLETPDRVGEAVPSSDGSVVVATLPDLDRWQVLPLAATKRATSIDAVAGRFDPDGLGRAPTPHLAGWCCAP